jgi:hypothetical protein
VSRSTAPSLLLAYLVTAANIASCAKAPLSAPEDDTASVQLSLTQAPPDVRCVRLVAEGAHRVVRTADTMPGASTRFTFAGLPTGPVVLGAEAFSTACAGIRDEVAPWLGEPVTVTLDIGLTVMVTLAMRRNGRAHLTANFVDDGSDAGVSADAGFHAAPDAGLAVAGGRRRCPPTAAER